MIARMHTLLIAWMGLSLLAGCGQMSKWRDKQTAIARGEYKEPAPPPPAPSSQPLFRPREFNAPDPYQDGPVIRADVMLVNGLTVRPSDVLEPSWARLEQLAEAGPAKDYPEKARLEVRQRLRETISEFLVWHEVKQKINAELDETINKAVDGKIRERINEHFQGSQAKFERYLAGRGLSLDDYKQQERRRLVAIQYLREEILPHIRISRRQLVEFYEQNRQRYETPARVRLQIIDLPDSAFLEGDASGPVARVAAHDKAGQQAKQALAALKAGTDFTEVARQYSKGIHAANGGDWDWISQPGLQGRWAQPSQAAFDLQAGQFSDIIEVSDGYFIVRAAEKVEAQRKGFQDVQAELEQQLRDQMFNYHSAKFLSKLWVKSDIQGLDTFRDRLLQMIPEPKSFNEPRP